VAFSVPTTRATGYVVTAANWNSDVVDNAAWLGRDAPHARVYNSTSFSHTTSGNWLAVTFDSERYDTGAMHSTASNTTRLTVPSGAGGVYAIGGTVDFAANTTGQRGIGLWLNGSTFLAKNVVDALASGGNQMSVYTEYLLAASDYVELLTYQSSGGALTISATGDTSPEFYASWRFQS
jgi:hypothetical protein